MSLLDQAKSIDKQTPTSGSGNLLQQARSIDSGQPTQVTPPVVVAPQPSRLQSLFKETVKVGNSILDIIKSYAPKPLPNMPTIRPDQLTTSKLGSNTKSLLDMSKQMESAPSAQLTPAGQKAASGALARGAQAVKESVTAPVDLVSGFIEEYMDSFKTGKAVYPGDPAKTTSPNKNIYKNIGAIGETIVRDIVYGEASGLNSSLNQLGKLFGATVEATPILNKINQSPTLIKDSLKAKKLNAEVIERVLNGGGTEAEKKLVQQVNTSKKGALKEILLAAKRSGGKGNSQLADFIQRILDLFDEGASKTTGETKLLTDGVKKFTPDEAVDLVINSEVKNTPAGKAIVKASIEAQKQGTEVVVSTVGDNVEVTLANQAPTVKYIEPKVFADSIKGTPGGSVALDTLKTPEGADINRVQVEAVKSSIQAGDKINPLVVTEDGVVEDGAHRLTALKEMGVKDVEVVRPPSIKEVEVPRTQLPIGEGKEKVSRLEARVKDALDNVSQETIDQLGLSTYNQMSNKDTIAKASEYVANNPEEALKVLQGEVVPPKGLNTNSIYVAMINSDIGNIELANKLASLSSTAAGQNIEILKEIDPDSPIKIMSDIYKVKEQVFKKRYAGKSVKDVTQTQIKKVKAAIKPPTIVDWNSIIEEVRC